MSATYLQQAFEIVLPDAEQGEEWYVVLVCERPFYGGPEEGGWWGSDTTCAAARVCFNKGEAERYAAQVRSLADELTKEARERHGSHCENEMDWLEARGLSADFLPEPDGEEQYYVLVRQGIPEPCYGSRRYE
jgi:hypothetical protein